MTDQLLICRLKRGYLIQTPDGAPLIAASDFDDLVGVLRKEFDDPERRAMAAVLDQIKDKIKNAPTAAQPAAAEPAKADSKPEPEKEPAAEPKKEPAAELEPTAPAGPAGLADSSEDLPVNQQKVLDHLQLCAMKHGERFQLSSRILAEKAGVSLGSLFYFTGELERKGWIRVESQGRGNDPFYVVPLPAEDEDA